MKKFKAIAAVLTAAAVMMCAFAASAATGVTITGISVNSDSNQPLGESADGAMPSVTPEDLITVNATVAGAADGDQAAILSVANGAAAIDNESIQYVDQVDVVEGAASVTFRPRYLGTFDMKMGATGVSTPDVGYYAVEEAKVNPTFGPTTAEITIGDKDAATFSITAGYNAKWSAAAVVKNSSSNAVEGATIGGDAEIGTGTVTIPLAGLTAGTYTYTVEAAGYTTVTLTVVLSDPAPQTIVPGAANALALLAINGTLTESEASITLPESVTVGETTMNITWSLAENANVSKSGNTVTYDGAAEAVTAVVLTATINGDDPVSATFNIILMPAGKTELSFGNIAGAKEEVFEDDEKLAEYVTAPENATEIAQMKAEALKVVIGRANKGKLAGNGATLDYNYNGTVSLSEYEIFARMLKGDPNFTVTAVKGARPAKN
ncbi:MAG: carboxypeptidase regulatory-like domain-containing protein [Ruminococcaceae bacterium]|nr:carboxypeptidase regulatory-like domain-containing protein [Oscillospiraceae bacterium]